MVTYQDFAQDLRTLAAMLDHLAPNLPLPKYDIPLGLTISVPEEADVAMAAKAIHTAPVIRGGQTFVTARIDTVEIKWIYHSPESMAAHLAQQSYSANLDATRVHESVAS